MPQRPRTPVRRKAPLDDPALGALRARIDRLDRTLLTLLNTRAELALAIGRIKQRAGVPARVPGRERDVVARAVAQSRGPLGPAAVTRLFRQIIHESVRVQQRRPGTRPGAAPKRPVRK